MVSLPIDEAPVDLTTAEHEVATLIADGKSNADIAKRRKTSVRTVANQVAALLKKLGVPSRHHVARVIRRPTN